MIRSVVFVFGLVLFLAGAASNFERIPMPIDSKSIVVGIGPGSFTLDVVLIVAGVFVMLVAWLMHKINPLT